MTNNYKNLTKFRFLAVFLTLSCISFSQTKEQVAQITAEYDLKKGEELYQQVKKREEAQKKRSTTFFKETQFTYFQRKYKRWI